MQVYVAYILSFFGARLNYRHITIIKSSFFFLTFSYKILKLMLKMVKVDHIIYKSVVLETKCVYIYICDILCFNVDYWYS